VLLGGVREGDPADHVAGAVDVEDPRSMVRGGALGPVVGILPSMARIWIGTAPEAVTPDSPTPTMAERPGRTSSFPASLRPTSAVLLADPADRSVAATGENVAVTNAGATDDHGDTSRGARRRARKSVALPTVGNESAHGAAHSESGRESEWGNRTPSPNRPRGPEYRNPVASCAARRRGGRQEDSAGDMISHLMRPSTSGSRHARSSARRLRQSSTEGAPSR
jgi:hypothetical protein